jgi:SNF2-related domain/SNF2 Helicase protein/Helicase conserved C-terminal domain
VLVIHATWACGALSLWAEDSGRLATVGVAGPGLAGNGGSAAGPGRTEAPSHPFACDRDELTCALAELGEPVTDLVRKATEAELTLWLPTERGAAHRPVRSPELAAGDPGRAAAADGRAMRATLAAWQLPVLSFDPTASLALLDAFGQYTRGALAGRLPGLSDRGAWPERCVPGGSIGYLAAIAALAGDLAGRGRVLPGADSAEEQNGSSRRYVAAWRPVLAGPDALRARELAAAVPPICRATSEDGEPSAVVFSGALRALTDAAVRTRLATHPGFRLLAGTARSLPDRWLDALIGQDGQFAVSPAERAQAAQLAFALWAWQDSAQLPPGPVRTCFRLIEPPAAQSDTGQDLDAGARVGVDGQADGRADPAEGAWRVELALQSSDDPSLLLPAADIWSGAAADGWAAAGVAHPEEDLLAGLGRASRLFGELDAELQRAEPESITLDTRGALRFLKETGPMLAGAGFGVLLPDWVRKSRLGLKLSTRSRKAAESGSATSPRFGLDDLVDFRYDLAVGGQTLSREDLAELARLKVPLVRLRGQWVELDERHLKAALHFLERRGNGVMTAGEALLAGLGQEVGDLPPTEVDADGWLGDLLSGGAEHRLTPMPTPAGFRGALRPYQERGLAWLSFLGKLGLGAVLADDMGLGKSPQTLAVLQAERKAGAAAGPTLLVCPMSLVGNWQREAAKFTPELTLYTHHGADRLSGAELSAAMGAADLVITTYGVAARDLAELAGQPWARVVCDEAQNIKNAATRQAQAVRAIPARSRVALTGTPVENRLAELWSIMQFTSPGLLGPAGMFRQRFALPIERNGDAEATEQLKRITGPFILRRLKTDKAIIADLPDKLEMKVWCNLTAEQASLYQATVDDMMARIEAAEPGIERRGLVLATMARLKQVCNHPAHLLQDGSRLDGRSGKLARLEETCDEIVSEGDKALCFTQYAEFGSMLQPYLAARLGCQVLYLHGGTAKKRRDELVTQFQESGEPAVFLLSLKAGGTGLNLTAANHVIHIDRWWNPAVEDQATDRAFRIGQRRDVQVRKFVCVGTVEERIDAMIEEKKALAERIVGTGEGWLTELSVADLRRVVELSPEAVSQ